MPAFLSKELFAVDGLKLTVGIVIAAVLIYWLVFMRR